MQCALGGWEGGLRRDLIFFEFVKIQSHGDHRMAYLEVIAKQSAHRNWVYNASAKLYSTSGLSERPNSSTSRFRVMACSSVCLYLRSREVYIRRMKSASSGVWSLYERLWIKSHSELV